VVCENLFEVLGIIDTSQYTRQGVERAWCELSLAAQNAESAVHQAQQFAYQYLTSDDPGAKALLEYLLKDSDGSSDSSNLVLHRTLIVLAESARPFTVPNAEIASLLVQHAGATGLEIYRHDSDPYLYALTFIDGIIPGNDFVPAHQAGSPLKEGKPRWRLSGGESGQASGPQSFADHLVEFSVDLFLFRWLRTDRLITKCGKILLLVAVFGLIWCGIELFAERADVWTVRGYAKDIIVTTDNAEHHLRDVRKWFREVELVGKKKFGWKRWWATKPTSEFSLALLRGLPAKKEAFLEICTSATEIDNRINTLTEQVDSAAERSRRVKSKDKVYQSQRTADEVEALLRDLEALSNSLEQYIALY